LGHALRLKYLINAGSDGFISGELNITNVRYLPGLDSTFAGRELLLSG
jgi:hypothetical protein